MRKVLFTLATLLLVIVANAQIQKMNLPETTEIGEVQATNNGTGLFVVSCSKTLNTYRFVFQDAKYSHIEAIQSFSFDDVDGAFDSLYTELMTGFKTLPKEPLCFKLKEYTLFVNFINRMGVKRCWFTVVSDIEPTASTGEMSARQITKLFGKR